MDQDPSFVVQCVDCSVMGWGYETSTLTDTIDYLDVASAFPTFHIPTGYHHRGSDVLPRGRYFLN